jgi:hypothetical protein
VDPDVRDVSLDGDLPGNFGEFQLDEYLETEQITNGASPPHPMTAAGTPREAPNCGRRKPLFQNHE